MRLPVITGTIKRRLLINYRAEPAVVETLLPAPFRPKIHKGYVMAGICLIRLEHMRPRHMPDFLGLASENAAHRFAVEWDAGAGVTEEGVYVPRRDTDSLLTLLAGGRLFPGEQHPAKFSVTDDGTHIKLDVESEDEEVSISIVATEAPHMTPGSIFTSAEEASQFFEKGDVGFSATGTPGRFDGLRLATDDWRATPLAVSRVESSFFDNRERFPEGSIAFDHALVMREIVHEWHSQPDVAAELAT